MSSATARDFLALLKPRVMSLVVFTALVGLVAAPGKINPFLGFLSILAIAVGAGASGALNMWYDADVDAIMSRTANRPIPAGRVFAGEALGFGIFLSVASVVVLGLASNWLAAGLLAFTIFFYAVVYTMWLKRSTSQNIVIGGAAGAFPPMIGWAAVTGTISIESVLLFAIIFFWTPPHFWALALVKSQDYAKANIPMLPVTHGEDTTRFQILLYTLFVVPLAIVPFFIKLGGAIYLACSLGLGAGMIVLAISIYKNREGAPAAKAAWRMFGFSIFYLFGLFAAILIEKLTGLGGGF